MDKSGVCGNAVGTGESDESHGNGWRGECLFGTFDGEWFLCRGDEIVASVRRNPNVEIRNPKQIRMTNKEKEGMSLVKTIFSAVALLAFLRCHAAEVRVFAAASLTDSMKEVASAYEKESGDKVVFNFGASSMLARQIEEGAPADIFFSADEAKMDGLESKGLIEKGTRKNRLSNSLVIIVATENVRAALAAVEAGNADASIVYKTDATISKRVKVAFEVPVEEGPKIRYPMAIVKEAKERLAAKKLFGYLSSDEAGK